MEFDEFLDIIVETFGRTNFPVTTTVPERGRQTLPPCPSRTKDTNSMGRGDHTFYWHQQNQ